MEAYNHLLRLLRGDSEAYAESGGWHPCPHPSERNCYRAFGLSSDADGWVVGTLAQFLWGVNANPQGSQYRPINACLRGCKRVSNMSASPSPSHPPYITEWGGKSALADCHALLDKAQWAYDCYKDGWPKSYRWDIVHDSSLDAIIHALQLWYCHHSIRCYLAPQTRRCLAATTIQCWKRHIWLDCWFAQQAKKRLHLRLLCVVLWHTPCWSGVLNAHLQPQPTLRPPQRLSNIPSITVFNHYQCGRGHDNVNNAVVVAGVDGPGPTLHIMEGGHCACP